MYNVQKTDMMTENLSLYCSILIKYCLVFIVNKIRTGCFVKFSVSHCIFCRYMLLPALLAYCTSRDTTQERSTVVKQSQVSSRDTTQERSTVVKQSQVS